MIHTFPKLSKKDEDELALWLEEELQLAKEGEAKYKAVHNDSQSKKYSSYVSYIQYMLMMIKYRHEHESDCPRSNWGQQNNDKNNP